MNSTKIYSERIKALTDNSRFWVLVSGITASLLIAGVFQLYVASGSEQTVKIEQCFAFISLALLYIALLASPFLKVFPRVPFKKTYTYLRRPIGVLAFYYASLHAYMTFFGLLGGFGGIRYYTPIFQISLLLAICGLGILCILASTSIDGVIRKMGFPNWKRMQRAVYIAGLFILIHIILSGPDFNNFSVIAFITYAAIIFLLILQVLRIRSILKQKKELL